MFPLFTSGEDCKYVREHSECEAGAGEDDATMLFRNVPCRNQDRYRASAERVHCAANDLPAARPFTLLQIEQAGETRKECEGETEQDEPVRPLLLRAEAEQDEERRETRSKCLQCLSSLRREE